MRDIDSEVCKKYADAALSAFEATRQVAEQNLDYEVGHSKSKNLRMYFALLQI